MRGGDMPRARDPNRDKAFEIYKKHKGKIQNIEISKILKVPEKTISGWKCKDKWNEKMNGVLQKNTEYSKQKNNSQTKAGVEEVKQVIENPELTDKQRLFCIYYVRCFNAVKAYQKAYRCSYQTAASGAYRMLENDRVKSEIYKLKQNRLNREFLSEEDVFQKYMDIAFADITDYVSFGTEEVPVMSVYGPVEIKNPKTGEKEILKQTANVVRFKDSTEIDGTILAEVKQGRDGASIKLADRMKALQWLSDHMNMATEEQKAKVEQMKARTEQIQHSGNNNESDAVQSWMDAVKKARESDG